MSFLSFELGFATLSDVSTHFIWRKVSSLNINALEWMNLTCKFCDLDFKVIIDNSKRLDFSNDF